MICHLLILLYSFLDIIVHFDSHLDYFVLLLDLFGISRDLKRKFSNFSETFCWPVMHPDKGGSTHNGKVVLELLIEHITSWSEVEDGLKVSFNTIHLFKVL